MKLLGRQKIWLGLVIAVNVLLWAVPSNVVEQIARDRQTMLGRYSRTHFGWNVAAAFLSLISFYIDWSRGATYRRRWFQVLTVFLVFLPTLVVLDFFLLAPGRNHYGGETLAYHHPPNGRFHRVFEDRPEAHRTYPNAPPGYGRVECTLTTDRRGFRNQTDLEQAEVVALGDSFVEGSNVSDEHAWPAVLADLSGRTVYNLGMSGYDPMHYLESLRVYGLPLKPRIVLCTLHEGNDFRSAKSDLKRSRQGFSERLKTYFKQSPVLSAMDRFLIETFGPINATGPVKGGEILDWMPLAIPGGDGGRHYAFAPKQLRDLCQGEGAFALDKHWLNPRSILAEVRRMCERENVRLVLVFAPTKAHVVMPLAAGRLPGEHVRSFTQLDYDEPLPEAETFVAELLGNIDAKELVLKRWCDEQGIPFLSLTRALQDGVSAGTQAYYTYDQHWTPDGHRVVAEAIDRFLRNELQLTLRP